MALYLPVVLEELSNLEDWGQYATGLAHHVIASEKSSGEMIGDILLSILVVHLTFVPEGNNPNFWLERLEDIIAQAKVVEGAD